MRHWPCSVCSFALCSLVSFSAGCGRTVIDDLPMFDAGVDAADSAKPTGHDAGADGDAAQDAGRLDARHGEAAVRDDGAEGGADAHQDG